NICQYGRPWDDRLTSSGSQRGTQRVGEFRFQQNGNRSNVSWDRRSRGKMQRLAVAVTATMLCCASATRAQAGTFFYPAEFAACQPLPSWYPRGWELMVRYPCVTYAYGPAYYL